MSQCEHCGGDEHEHLMLEGRYILMVNIPMVAVYAVLGDADSWNVMQVVRAWSAATFRQNVPCIVCATTKFNASVKPAGLWVFTPRDLEEACEETGVAMGVCEACSRKPEAEIEAAMQRTLKAQMPDAIMMRTADGVKGHA